MYTKSVLGSAFVALAMFATAPVFAAEADATPHQVYEAAEAGRFADAQAMMDKVLRDHPDKASAHWVEAQLLGKEGRMHDAGVELNTAERLDPSLSFVKNPQEIGELQARIAGVRPAMTMQRMQPAFSHQVVNTGNPSGGTTGLTVLIVIGLIAAFFFIARALGQRNTVMAGGSGYPGYGPGYGPGGANMPSYGPGMMGGQAGGGIGSGILGGLATGAAVGAGMVAGEELMHHFTDGNRNQEIYDTSSNNQNVPDDMGGNDFGVSDSSSWDSGGGGGGDDWN